MVGEFLARLIAAALFFSGLAQAGWVDSADPWITLAEPVFVNHLSEGGLPRATVTALVQDRDGFLWVGSQNGLARWDGYRAKLYQQNRADPRSLPDNYVLSLHLDTAGRLWVATSAGGLARYNPADDDFTLTEIGPSGISSSAVSAIEDDGKGGLWVGTDIALDHLGPDGRALEHLHPGEENGRVRALLRDSQGKLWIGTERGLSRLDSSAQAATRIAGVDAAVYSLTQDSQGRLWVGTKKKGVMLVAPGASAANPLPAPITNDWVLSMAETTEGEMWLATYGDGIIIVDRTSTRVRRLLAEGKTKEANQVLGRPYVLEGKVAHGKKMGRKIGFPTANLKADANFLPKDGVYACAVRIGKNFYRAGMNLGKRPTFKDDDHHRQAEVHLMRYYGSLYGKTLKVYLLGYLRSEKKFPTTAALVGQIKKDLKAIERLSLKGLRVF